MMALQRDTGRRLTGREGFVLPIVIFGLVLMSTVAVAALLTADDEQRSSRAMRESAAAFYAAEAGVNEVWATWPDSQVSELAFGDSLDLGWQTLAGGASYRALIHRQDNGGQKMYALRVEGRGPGPRGSQRVLSLAITAEPGGGGGGLTPWGGMGAVTGRAGWASSVAGASINGYDHEPSNWAGLCTDTFDAPGVVWDDSMKVRKWTSDISGVPPVVEDPNLANEEDFWKFGDVTWDSLVSIAEYTIENRTFGTTVRTSGSECVHPYTKTNWDGTQLYNLGAPNSKTSPCFNYFPIVHLKGNTRFGGSGGCWAGQGILLVDGHLTMDMCAIFYGIVIVRGCIDIAIGGDLVGAALVDGTINGCTGTAGFRVVAGSRAHWSSCVVKRTVENIDVEFGGGEDEFMLVSSRSFSEMLR